MTSPKALTRQLVVRVDEALYEHLKADAEANGRTVTQSARYLLSRAVPTVCTECHAAPVIIRYKDGRGLCLECEDGPAGLSAPPSAHV